MTNFPRESAFFSRLDRAKAEGEKLRTIGFAFNHIAEINSTRGRSFSDHLISTITGELNHRLSDRVAFYRLEGMRCAAVIDPRCQESPWQLAGWRDSPGDHRRLSADGHFGAHAQFLCTDGLSSGPLDAC